MTAEAVQPSSEAAGLRAPAVLAAGEEAPSSIVVDSANAYWLAGAADRRMVRTVDRRGRSKPSRLFDAPGALHLASGGSFLYWAVALPARHPTAAAALEIRGARIGGRESVIVKGTRFFVATRGAPIAADADGLAVLVSEEPAILHLPHGQKEARVIAAWKHASPHAKPYEAALGNPVLDVVASNGREVAWAGPATLRVIATESGPARDLSPASGSARASAEVVALAMDAEAVYAAARGKAGSRRTITAYPLDGGAPRVLSEEEEPEARDGCGRFLSVAVDAAHVYWTRACAGTVMRVSRSGGVHETVAEAQATPSAIAVAADAVVWINHGTEARDYRDGAVVTLAKRR